LGLQLLRDRESRKRRYLLENVTSNHIDAGYIPRIELIVKSECKPVIENNMCLR
jgi:hypothetical protein